MIGGLRRLGEWLTRLSRRYLPDPFIFAILLTLLVAALALTLTPLEPREVIEAWYKGFWELLTFAMQMVLILITGFALANAPLVRDGLRKLVTLPRTGPGVVALVGFAAALLGWLNWGLGLIAGAIMAREAALAARLRGLRVHYPLLAAAGYSGLAVWHGGFSGSAPLTANTAGPGNFMLKEIGRIVPLSETILTPMNLTLTLAAFGLIPALLFLLHPPAEESEGIAHEEAIPGEQERVRTVPLTPAQRLEESRLLAWVIVLAGLSYLIPFFVKNGLSRLDLNTVIFLFLILGLALHGTPMAYARAFAGGTRAASGIILQFPFYAGIMGIMKYTGLVGVIAGWFVAFSSAQSFPFWTLVSAGLVNLAVPSGGGQFAVQGPVIVEAAHSLGVPVGKAIMALSYGDELTNLIQPFWALPLLGITGLKAGEVMGYTATLMLFLFLLMAAVLFVF